MFEPQENLLINIDILPLLTGFESNMQFVGPKNLTVAWGP